MDIEMAMYMVGLMLHGEGVRWGLYLLSYSTKKKEIICIIVVAPSLFTVQRGLLFLHPQSINPEFGIYFAFAYLHKYIHTYISTLCTHSSLVSSS